MADPVRERDRAVRIAYAHARRGDDDAADAWLELAARFARPTDRQLEHAKELLRRSGPFVHPGQTTLAIAEAQAAQARARGIRDAAARYGA